MQRRLAAILAADVVGYSRLIGEDQVRTLGALRELRGAIFEPEVAAHQGIVIKRMGDGWLVEFGSVVDAVSCAITVQEKLAGHEFIKLRMGIHIGDIVHEDEDIYGDGVNIAARLQERAEPGGIAISDFAHDSLDGVIRSKFSSLGASELKNISRRVAIFGWGTKTPITPAAAPTTERPAVIVLPFATPGALPESEMLAAGLTDAVIVALSRFSWFITLPRNTSNLYRNKGVDIAELRHNHSVSYVLEGSLRTAGTRARVSAELLDARTGSNVWANKFDGDAEDPFELEDKLTRSILAELTPYIVGAEDRRTRSGGDGSAWDLMMQGRGLLWRVNREDVARAQELLKQAIALEPESGIGQSDLAWSYFFQRIYGWDDDFEALTANANNSAKLAIAADDLDAYAFVAASAACCLTADSAHAIALARSAIGLNYNLAAGHGILSLALFQTGAYEEAIAAAQTTRELSPRDPLRAILMGIRGIILLLLEQYEEMIRNAKEIIREFPDMPTGWRQLAAAYAMTGQTAEAERVVETQVLRLIPGLTAAASGQQVPFGPNDSARQIWVNALVKAGLPLK